MNVHYKVVSTNQPGAGKGSKLLWFPKLTGSSQMDLFNIAELMSKRSTANGADAYLIVKLLVDIIPELLSQGYTLKLGELGTFRLHAKVETSDSPEDVSVKNIKELRISFRPDNRIKDVLKGTLITPIKE